MLPSQPERFAAQPHAGRPGPPTASYAELAPGGMWGGRSVKGAGGASPPRFPAFRSSAPSLPLFCPLSGPRIAAGRSARPRTPLHFACRHSQQSSLYRRPRLAELRSHLSTLTSSQPYQPGYDTTEIELAEISRQGIQRDPYLPAWPLRTT